MRISTIIVEILWRTAGQTKIVPELYSSPAAFSGTVFQYNEHKVFDHCDRQSVLLKIICKYFVFCP